MKAQAWYRRTPAIIAALILLPPVGVVMMRLTGWSSRRRLLVGATATLWMLVVIGSMIGPPPASKRPTTANAPPHARSSSFLPEPRPATSPSAVSPPPAAAQPPTAPPPPTPGYDPRLWLVPAKVKGLPLAAIKRHRAGLLEARYESRRRQPRYDLVLAIMPLEPSGLNVGNDWTAVTVGKHEGRISPDYSGATFATVAWASGPWEVKMDLNPEHIVRDNRKRLVAAATDAAMWIDPFVESPPGTGGAVPDRIKQLAEHAVASVKSQDWSAVGAK